VITLGFSTGEKELTAFPFKIRPFTTDDYPSVVAVHNAVQPDFATTVEEWKFRDSTRDPKIRWARFLAEDTPTGEIVGYGGYGQQSDMWHPQKFSVNADVLESHRGRGVGSALHETVISALEEYNPIQLRAHAQECKPEGLRFLTKRGFTEEFRDWESRLAVPAFDFAPFAEAEKRVADAGITIKPLSELMISTPDWKERYYDIEWAIVQDMPAPDTLTQFSYENFLLSTLNNPNFAPEAIQIALDGDYWVGESALWKNQADNKLMQGGTGVRREYRRKGIALAMKLRGVAYAQSVGAPEIKTFNDQTNRAMLLINEALGFVKQPAWIGFVKTLAE
jgi:RimJ/RimL family protein N-acetyltransferase